jgi:hypothetical protein
MQSVGHSEKRAPLRKTGAVGLGLWIFFGLMLGVPSMAIVVGLTSQLIGNRYTWTEMDWNGDGRTSAGEILASVDIRVRSTPAEGTTCREFFSLKDGLVLRRTCAK